MTPGTRADALRLFCAGTEFASFRIAGALPGIVIQAAAAANGPGIGILSSSAGGLRWEAPGSSSPGSIVLTPADGSYLLEDSDKTKWVRVRLYKDYVPTAGEAQIYFADWWDALGPTDVSAANASAGIIEFFNFTLFNASPIAVSDVRLWIDPQSDDAAGLAVSNDAVNYFSPASESDPNVITWGSISPGSSVTFYMKRTILAGASSDPSILNAIEWAWNGI